MSNYSFLSFNNTNMFFNNLIKSNETPFPLKHIYELLNDLTTLLHESDCYDMEIKIGEDKKIFKAHSNILKARSSYFKVALSKNWVKKSKDGIILFEKENISPKSFKVLLTYIYNGTVNIDNFNPDEILELLEACDELNFNELIEGLQNHLFVENKEWVQKNLIHIHKVSSKHQSFSLLQDYCDEIINETPELLFLKSNDIAAIEKSMLITILKSDLLKLTEIEIWDYVIQWGFGQREASEKNISEWSKGDFIEMKNILNDIIPLVRFNLISSNDFCKKIKQYRKVFNKDIYDEIIGYYLSNECQPRSFLQKDPRIGQRGKLLDSIAEHFISNWINGIDNNNNSSSYKFELIFSSSKNGTSRSVFERKCYNVEQTVVIMKIKNTGELIGGYNPVCWNIKEMSPNDTYRIETNKSFIFKIYGLDHAILSKVKKPKRAIYHDKIVVNLSVDNIKFHERLIDFSDLDIRNSIDNEPYCYYNFHSYGYDLSLEDSSKKVHLLEEFEIYRFQYLVTE